MKVKSLALAVAALAVAAVAVWYFKPHDNVPDTDPRVGKTLIDADLVPKVTSIRLKSAGKDITLVNTEPAGVHWIVKEYHDLPADFSKLSSFIQSLRDAKIVAFASANPQRLAKMEFGDSSVELRDKDDKTVWSVNLGRTAENEIRFIKFGTEEKAYRATFSVWLDTTPKNWAEAVIVPVKPEKVTAINVDFPNGDGAIQFKRENAEADWTADGLGAGEKVRSGEVTSLVGKLAGLRFTETSEPTAPDAVAAREKLRTLKLTTADGKEYTVALGRRPAPPAPPAPPPAPPSADGSPPPTPPAPQPGPVYAFVRSSLSTDPINAAMDKLGFQISEWTFTGLPADRYALVQAAPPTLPLSPEAAARLTPATPPTVSEPVPVAPPAP